MYFWERFPIQHRWLLLPEGLRQLTIFLHLGQKNVRWTGYDCDFGCLVPENVSGRLWKPDGKRIWIYLVFFAATMCLIGFCKIAGKLDSYMASLGVSMGRTMGGLSGLGALMMAGRLLSGGGRGRGASTAASGSAI